MPYYDVSTQFSYLIREPGEESKPARKDVHASIYAISDEAVVRAFSIHGFWDYTIRNEEGELIKEVHVFQMEAKGKLADYNPWIDWLNHLKANPVVEDANMWWDEQPLWDYRFEVAATLSSMSEVGIEDRKEFDRLSYLMTPPRMISDEDRARYKEILAKYKDENTTSFVNHCMQYGRIFGVNGYQGFSS